LYFNSIAGVLEARWKIGMLMLMLISEIVEVSVDGKRGFGTEKLM
jgi:hypothetical protein